MRRASESSNYLFIIVVIPLGSRLTCRCPVRYPTSLLVPLSLQSLTTLPAAHDLDERTSSDRVDERSKLRAHCWRHARLSARSAHRVARRPRNAPLACPRCCSTPWVPLFLQPSVPRWAWIFLGLLDVHDPTHLHRQHADSFCCLREVLAILTDGRCRGHQQRPRSHIPGQSCLLGLVAERYFGRGSYGVSIDVSGLSLLSPCSRNG